MYSVYCSVHHIHRFSDLKNLSTSKERKLHPHTRKEQTIRITAMFGREIL